MFGTLTSSFSPFPWRCPVFRSAGQRHRATAPVKTSRLSPPSAAASLLSPQASFHLQPQISMKESRKGPGTFSRLLSFFSQKLKTTVDVEVNNREVKMNRAELPSRWRSPVTSAQECVNRGRWSVKCVKLHVVDQGFYMTGYHPP